jgi:hypothetical protein
MTPLVSDQVWHQLDPAGGSVQRRTVHRFRLAVVPTFLVLLVVGVTWASGGFVPWLHQTATGFAFSAALDDANGRVGPRDPDQTMNLSVQNSGWRPVRVVEVGSDRTGFRMLRATIDDKPVSRRSPYVVAPGETVEITLFLRFTDCQAVSAARWAVPIRIARPWGIQTVHVDHLPIAATSDRGGWTTVYRGDPRAVEWQRWIADDVCGVPYGRRAPGKR